MNNRIFKTILYLEGKTGEGAGGIRDSGGSVAGRSLDVARAMIEAGLDILELGVPFSDPTADGPVIQRASARALAAGAGLPAILGLVRALRRESEIPIVLFSYYNPIHAYGPTAVPAGRRRRRGRRPAGGGPPARGSGGTGRRRRRSAGSAWWRRPPRRTASPGSPPGQPGSCTWCPRPA